MWVADRRRDDAGPQRLAQLPGPPSWPLVGHLFKFDEARLHLQLEDWSRVYGALYRLRFLRTDPSPGAGPGNLNSQLEEVLPVINARLHALFPYWRSCVCRQTGVSTEVLRASMQCCGT